MPTFFNGELLITPTARSAVDDSQMYDQGLATGQRVALLGRSDGGEPGVPIVLRSPAHAKQVLISGELLDAVRKAFAPSGVTRGPSDVTVVRVNPATQSTLTLKDANTADAIVLTSTDYGLRANQIKVKVEAGTNVGKRLTTQLGDGYYTRDDVARGAFTVQYSGAEATATMTVSNSQVILYAPAATPVATIELATYGTVQELVDRINVVASFAATVVAGSATKVTLNGLDGVTGQDVKSAAYTARADLQACIDWFNSIGEGFVNATRAVAGTLPPTTLAFTYLTGGSDGTITNQEWTDAFDALQSVDVQYIVPVSVDPDIHAMAQSHCEFMSGAGRRERRCFVGGDTGVTLANAALAAAAFNSDRVAYCYPDVYEYDEAGDLTLYPAWLLAAAVAGAFSGIEPGTPLTNKPLTFRGVGVSLAEPTDTDYCIESGVLALYPGPKGDLRVAKSVTTWLTDTRFNRVEVSTGIACDFVSREVRDSLAEFVGAKGSAVTLEAVKSRVDTTLRALSRAAPAGPELLVGDRDNPPYRNIDVSLEGDVIRVEFEGSPVIPANYVLITFHAVPYSGRV